MRRICFPFSGDAVGGSHISALGLVKQLDRTRFTPLVLVDALDGAIAALFRSADVEIVQAPRTPGLNHGERLRPLQIPAIIAAAERLRAVLRDRQIDIVHTNDGRTHAVWALPARLAGCRLVWHHRGAPDALGLRLVAPLLASHVVSVSRFAAGAHWGRRSSSVIHSPFDTTVQEDRRAARRALLDELGVGPDTQLVGFFGALIDRKRPLLFVDAIARMRAIAPDRAVLGLIFGEPFDVTNALIEARAAQQGISNAIAIMGFRAPGSRWIAGCDLLLCPAIDEPFGRTLIEAMLVGTPIIATASGGNPDALRDGALGVLVPPENPAALASAANSLLADTPRLHDLVTLAAADARVRFGERQHADAVMAIYDTLTPPPARRYAGADRNPRSRSPRFRSRTSTQRGD
ncbi:glycosyltransferase [Sphingomonas sp. SUN019]|uniref:glycosyltransferase n=1 Tax=Sphingomonas sp. SUN019 TaxID=2937788 RepID=UPI0021644BFD|nr:glycosyltransferase [Sphingomonas sp. SUN019]UVO51671.1 glycosyltransferase [Sphingomonas sp. SUN019]